MVLATLMLFSNASLMCFPEQDEQRGEQKPQVMQTFPLRLKTSASARNYPKTAVRMGVAWGLELKV